MRLRVWPRSLFGRTAATLAVTMALFLVVSMGSVAYFVVIPMAKRSATDFAAELVSAADSLSQLPASEHATLRDQLLRDHELTFSKDPNELPDKVATGAYLAIFRDSLAQLTGQELPIITSDGSSMLWVDVPANGDYYRLGFDRGRLGINVPLASLLALASGGILIMIASILEVRRVTRPVEHLSAAIVAVGHGQYPVPVPEEGPDEIRALARTFNKMAADVRSLSENRTVMISGVSHDLRTPLTRMAIAAEMLDESSHPEIVAGIRRDIEVMNRLIGQFLQFSESAADSCPVQMNLWHLIESVAMDLRRGGADVRLHRHDPPCVFFGDPDGLERVLSNLMENAVNYGKGRPVDVHLRCTHENVAIEVCDRGVGIPLSEAETVFRPFHRVEPARSASTGGSGLGLSISRQIADRNGWAIDLLPRDGGGTIARLRLPPCQRYSLERKRGSRKRRSASKTNSGAGPGCKAA